MSNRDYRDDRYDRRMRQSERDDTNFDRMYDAKEYRRERDDYDEDGYSPMRRRQSVRDGYYEDEPREKSFFRNTQKRRRTKDIDGEIMPSNNPRNYDSRNGVAEHFVISSPKSFDDIQKMIDALKTRQALIVDLGKVKDKSVQRVMDYLYGAVYALDGCIEKITEAVFLLTPTGMSISVPLDYIKDRVEKNRRR